MNFNSWKKVKTKMNKRTTVEKIYMEAKHLGPDISNNILNVIQKRMTGHCDQKNGYILDIDDDIEIVDNDISNAGTGVFFTVKYTVYSLKPSKGDEFEGEVIMVFEDGVIIEVKKLMKIFISKSKLPDYKFSKSKMRYKSKNKTISVGDILRAEVESIEYERRNFNCIGCLKE